jgi:60 kDa SS-A/Ro ribonucleoprotein
MAPNRGGGVGFIVTDDTLIQRILILGTSKGYYTSAEQNTDEAVKAVKTMLADGKFQMVHDILKDVYESGRAAKQDPTFAVLALLCVDKEVENRKKAWEIVKSIRTFSHLCTFLKFYMAVDGGWGRLPKRSLNEWVTKYNAHDLAYQVFKYLSRDGWDFRDVLRCIHVDPTPLPKEVQVVLKLMVLYGKKDLDSASAFQQALQFGQEIGAKAEDMAYLDAIRFLKTCKEDVSDAEITSRIYSHRFTHEFLPKWALTRPAVWKALLISQDGSRVTMPMNALIRNLATMTVRGLFNEATVVDKVCAHLKNADAVKGSKIHPAQVAVAWKQYEQGRGDKGKQTWVANHSICQALEKCMELAFANVEATGKRIWHCFDGSGSMDSAMGVAGNMTSAEAVALMGLICSRAEAPYTQQYCIFSSARGGYGYGGASTGLRPVIMSPKSSLTEAARVTQITDWGSTDCSLPMEEKIKEFNAKFTTLHHTDQVRFRDAVAKGDTATRDSVLSALGLFLPEVFVIYTDNDVNSGRRHPCQALQEYRRLTGIPAKMAVVATQSSRVTIADPHDAGMMDLVGFDSQLPQVLHDFICDKL